MKSSTLCLLAVLSWCVVGSAQATTPGRKFEVASIHQVDMNLIEIIRTGRASVSVDGAIATFKAQSPILLITRAFGVLEDQVINFPETSRGIFFDIDAKLPEGVTKDLVPEMLQSLLADRFKLAIRRQEETRPVYELLPAGDGKLQASDGAGPGRCAMQTGHRMCRAMTMAELVATINNVGQLA